MGDLELFYGDLHWHTRYSDNRDKASVDRMVRAGVRHGYRVLGTGDHNHNLTADSWRSELAETRRVAGEHPDITILNNCELTFLAGHFLVFQPGVIDGTIDEAYRFLLGERDGILMLNHPGLPSDEWRERFVPHASAIELVNGAVLREAARKGFRLDAEDFPFNLPSIQVFASYLDAGIPLAAIGSSDAHALSEVGYGCTGFWLSGGGTGSAPPIEEVLEAIRSRRTYAASDPKVMLAWQVEPHRDGGTSIAWECSFPGVDPPEVRVFERRRLVAAGGRSGSIAVERAGIYWLSARSGKSIAFSSALVPEFDRPRRRRPTRHGPPRLSDALAIDEARFRFAPPRLQDEPLGRIVRGEEMEIFCSTSRPEIVDREGRSVEFEVERDIPPRVVIGKNAGPEALEEFLVWFERNEIHEYRFDGIEISLEGDLLTLQATMLPAWADRRRDRETRAREHASQLLPAREGCRACRIDVVVPRRLTIRFTSARAILPLESAPSRQPTEGLGRVPRGTILRLSIPGGTRLDQFFLDPRSEALPITRQG